MLRYRRSSMTTTSISNKFGVSIFNRKRRIRYENSQKVWRILVDDVRDVYHDEIARWEELNGREGVETHKAPQIKWATAVRTTAIFSLLRPLDIERALGQDFVNVRSERWRTVPILVYLPRFVANAFELDPSIPPKLAVAHRIEQILLEFFTTEHVTENATDEVPRL